MNKTVQLVNAWAEFEEKHGDSDVEDFCRYYLIQQREARNRETLFNGEMIPPRPEAAFSKLMGRIMTLFDQYATEAVKSIGLKRPWEFYFLNYIAQMKNPKKTEVIYEHLCELSTGLSILETLKSGGYIVEKEDPEDKRSRRVSLTEKGQLLLTQCYHRFTQVGEIVFGDVDTEDLKLCIQIMQSVDSKHIKAWPQVKGKSFAEMYMQMIGKELPELPDQPC